MRALTAAAVVALLSGSVQAESVEGLFERSAPGPGRVVDHSAWDRLLKTYVRQDETGLNRVDYAALKSGAHASLKAYIRNLQAVDPQTLARPEQFAFLVNLYNAVTVDVVLDHYPVQSIKDISLAGGLAALFTSGPWQEKVVRMKGVALSLDDIEHNILRRIFEDPRIHYAVNCASVGCPNLSRDAYTGSTLDGQLDRAARAYVNSARGVAPGPQGMVVSSIYDWYQEDFGGTEDGVIAHLRKYAAPPLARELGRAPRIAGYRYDWVLNDVRR
jgi:uncharacterized protein DUF547